MKILQINCVYRDGSTGKITSDLHHELLLNNVESVVYYGRGAETSDKNVYKICGEFYSRFNHFLCNLTGLMYGSCYLSTRKIKRYIIKEKPDIVHLQCINGYFVNIYDLIAWLKSKRIKTVLTLHAEFMYTGNCGYALDCNQWQNGCTKCANYKKITSSYFFDRTKDSWNKMQKSFDGFNDIIIASVSPWMMERAQSSKILSNKKHTVVLNGVDIDVFKCYTTSELRKKYASNDEKILLHVTSYFSSNINHTKGGYHLLELAKMLKGKNYKILVVGNHESNIQVPDNVVLLGKISDQKDLAKLYSMSDVTILTSKQEAFSMVVAESLCCGTPVVGFESGAPEQIAIKKWSRFSPFGNISELYKNINEVISNDLNSTDIRNDAVKKYSKQTMLQNYMHIYDELTKL